MRGVWTVCDVFRAFDTERTGYVTRKGYIQRLGDPPSVERVRVLRRANLSRRFRDNASPVSLDEMLHLVWPSASTEDQVTMRRWAELRDIFHMFHNSDFQGSDEDMLRAFDLLAAGGDYVIAADLVQAGVLGLEDASSLSRARELRRYKINLLQWKDRWWPTLKAMHVSPEMVAKLRQAGVSLQMRRELQFLTQPRSLMDQRCGVTGCE